MISNVLSRLVNFNKKNSQLLKYHVELDILYIYIYITILIKINEDFKQRIIKNYQLNFN